MKTYVFLGELMWFKFKVESKNSYFHPQKKNMRKIPIIFFLLATFVFYQCMEDKNKPSQQHTSKLTGEELAKTYCIACHQYPTPDLLDKKTWSEFVLIRMGAFMGIYQEGEKYVSKLPQNSIEPGIGGQRIKAANVYPDKPLLTTEEWEKIIEFYITNAPAKLPAAPKRRIRLGIPLFESKPFSTNKTINPLVQSMAVDEDTKAVFAAEFKGGIFKYDFKGKQLDYFPAESHVVKMQVDKNEMILLDMATRYASDNPKGTFSIANSFEDIKQNNYKTNIQKLMRPVDFAMGDLTGNGREDIVVAEYGNLLGALSWLENKEDGNYERYELFPDDGSIKSEIMDLNQDGKNDIIALKGNSDEGIDWYLNQGDGKFQRERKLRFPPTNGSTHFQMIDFDNDGVEDILYSNGDNGDYTPILKPYHGIHLFLNKNGNYEEEFFIPLNGVYQSEAVDFDEDGDLDIAAVSFHPDFEKYQREGFVVFMNDGNNKFTAHTIPQFRSARWMRFVTTDIDGDKDVDILLSAMNIKTPEIPETVAANWGITNDAIILLRNKLR